MKKISIKVVALFLVILLINSICSGLSLYSEATEPADSGSGGSIESAIDKIGNSTKTEETTENAVTTILATVLNAVRIAGAAIAILMLLVVATKYIIASAGDRADIKKSAVNYVIGALIFLGASGILTIIKDFVLTNTGGSGS